MLSESGDKTAVQGHQVLHRDTSATYIKKKKAKFTLSRNTETQGVQILYKQVIDLHDLLKNVLNLAPNEQFPVQQIPLLLSSQHDTLSPLLSQLVSEQILV